MDNFLKWLTAILSIVAIITVLLLIFFVFWSIKARRRAEREASKASNDDSRRYPRSYDVDSSLPHKPSFSEGGASALRPKESNPYSPYTPTQTPDTDVRSRRPGPAIHPEEDRSLLGLNTSV